MNMKRGSRLVVHVTLDDYSRRYGQSIDEVILKTSQFRESLEKHRQGWERPSADEAVLITNSNGRVQSMIEWLETLRKDIRSSTQIDASIGVASTRLAARIASRLARPRGLLLLLPGYEQSFISSISLEELDELRPAQTESLRRKGMRTLGDLAELPPEEARDLLGPEYRKLLRLVRGIEGRNGRSRGDSRLEKAIEILCRRASKKLRDGGAGARGLELYLAYRDGVTLERYTLMPRAAQSAGDLQSSAYALLRLFPSREVGVTGLSLTATGISTLPGQLPLFSRPREVRIQLGNLEP
jgi:DNA polymerase-4